MDDLTRLIEVEAIKRLKGRYCRAVDTGAWHEMASYVTEDLVTFVVGFGEFQGRDTVIEQTRAAYEALDEPWQHHAILPDIEITSATAATGVWTFGSGHYEDEYVKEDGAWKIKVTRVLRP